MQFSIEKAWCGSCLLAYRAGGLCKLCDDKLSCFWPAWSLFPAFTVLEWASGIKRGRNSDHHLALKHKSNPILRALHIPWNSRELVISQGWQGTMLHLDWICLPWRYHPIDIIYVFHPFVMFLHPWWFRNTFVNRVWPKWALSVWVWPPVRPGCLGRVFVNCDTMISFWAKSGFMGATLNLLCG